MTEGSGKMDKDPEYLIIPVDMDGNERPDKISYPNWLSTMYQENCTERHQSNQPIYFNAEEYEKKNYDFLQAQYSLYVNDGLFDIEFTFHN